MEPHRAGRSRVRLTARDLELLAFAAEHRLVLPAHAEALLGVSGQAPGKRLAALSRAGLLAREQPFHRHSACYQIRAAGLDAIDSDLRPPRRLDLRSYEHEVGAAWLWLAARAGTFGELRAVLGERRLRSFDARREGDQRPYGVRLGGVGPHGEQRLHYPDLLLFGREGRRIAIELELSSKGRARRERILAGYGADARVDVVLYLVRDRRIGVSIQESARRLGAGSLVHVQRVRLDPAPKRGAPGPAVERSHARADARAAEAAP